jgi:hypothetical protein
VKKLLTIIVNGSILLFGMAAFALTVNEAKTNIDSKPLRRS